MIVSGYSLSVSRIYAQTTAEITSQNAVRPAINPAGQAPPEQPLPETEPGDNTKVRGENGVLRLLQEGHFKPQAEMRLREIFHRDLTMLQELNQPNEDPIGDPPVEDHTPSPAGDVEM